ncbi:uncharacterized protein N7483_005824 [Penicillium malachiteum]|uniref:uncharacterized protein n=1 Tax=Penicillium malachiteum TaxID=1324776 RepID=UPI0025482EB4|nr:uncharacterized protein N7483_005824 [Penicillium malachiteum]KAJ5731316.1 hypothetical protein N7483_005824 [Penicillium malachiteum]
MFGLRQSKMLATTLVAVLLSSFIPSVSALRVASGSSCTDVCSKWGSATNTTASEISCLDTSYNSTTKGEDFKDCISCELNSTYVDSATGETDVNWGLFNLRYALSTCVFGYPSSISNTSSPCPVACGTIQDAIQYDITDPTVNNIGLWCDTASFADNVISVCEFCYSLTWNQLFLTNFLESIRYNCHYPTTSGDDFAISPTRIFSDDILPSTLSMSHTSSGLSKTDLILVIVIPILAFIILCCGIGTCCFFFIRYRRKRSRENNYQDHLYARWNDTTITTPTPGQDGFDQQKYTDYQAFAQMHAAGYGLHSGFNQEQYGQAHEMYGIKNKGFQEQTNEMVVPAPYTDNEQAPHNFGIDQKHAM